MRAHPPSAGSGIPTLPLPQAALPAPALQRFLRGYGGFSADVPPDQEFAARVIPPGVPIMTVVLSGEIRITDGPAAGQLSPATAFTGQLTHSGGTACRGTLDCFVAQFTPAGAHDLLGVNMSQLQDTTVELREVIGPEADVYAEAMREAPEFVIRCQLTDNFFRARLTTQTPGLGAAAAQLLTEQHGQLDVTELAQRLGVSERTLLRRFNREVGVSPKHYARLMRFRAAHTYLQTPDADWAGAVLRFGYTDQSHLIRDYHDFAGETPRQYSSDARMLDRSMAVVSKPQIDEPQ